jgi:hypothetical protein
MFKAIKEFFTGKPAVQETVTEAPYKVEVQPQVVDVTVAVEGAGLVEAPAKKPRAKKPAAPKAPAVKKPRKTK